MYVFVLLMIGIFCSNNYFSASGFRQQAEIGLKSEKQNNFLPQSNAPNAYNFSQVSGWDENYGIPVDYLTLGELLFVASAVAGLVILNASDPTNLSVISKHIAVQSAALTINDSYVFLATNAGIEVINVSDVYHPNKVASYYDGGNARGVHFADDLLYVADGEDGLEILNVSVPMDPSKIGEYDTTEEQDAYEVFVNGSIAFIADYWQGLISLDISDPTNPILLDSYNGEGHSRALQIENEVIYLAEDYRGLRIINGSNPENLTEISLFDRIGKAFDLTKKAGEDYLFLAVDHKGVECINVSNKAAPTLIDSFDDGGEIKLVFRYQNYIYAGEDDAGIEIIDCSDPSNLVKVGLFQSRGYGVLDVVVEDGLAYIANYRSMVVLNISDPLTIELVGKVELTDEAGRILVEGNIAYVAEGKHGLTIINISNPTTPEILASAFNVGWTIENMFINGTYIYLLDPNSMFITVDISNPVSPKIKSEAFKYIGHFGMAVKGIYAITTTRVWGLATINIQNPTAPFMISSTKDLCDFAIDIEIEDDIAFVTDYTYGLRIIDVSDPLAPALIASFETESEYVTRLTRNGSIVYLSTDDGIEVLNISDYSDIKRIGKTTFEKGITLDVFVEGEFVYAPTIIEGLQVLGVDHDCDQLADYLERTKYSTDPTKVDSDADLMSDGFEVRYGFDPLNSADGSLDEDGDGLLNADEAQAGTNPLLVDTDFDTLPDGDEINVYGSNPLVKDTDGDGLSDPQEVNRYFTDPTKVDSDNDTLPDGWEIQNQLNPTNASDALYDLDEDGLLNVEEYSLGTNIRDNDTDEDNLSDGAEVNTYETDPNIADSDQDGILDGDEVLLYGSNPLLVDSDDDNLSDFDEVFVYGTNPSSEDTDSDQIPDYFEVTNGLDPTTNDATEDPDGDGLTNYEEYLYLTDPLDADSDNDGFSDKEEIDQGTDPRNPYSYPVSETSTPPTANSGIIWSPLLVGSFVLIWVFVVIFTRKKKS